MGVDEELEGEAEKVAPIIKIQQRKICPLRGVLKMPNGGDGGLSFL